MKKYDLSRIMSAAWKIFRKGVQSFAVALTKLRPFIRNDCEVRCIREVLV